MIVEKKVFTLPSYTTVGGQTLKNVQVGYETYGRLNAAGDNAIFVAHFYSGTSHCAGRYKADDPLPGYWDPIIGPGKAIDTDRYFVVSADTLVNLNAKDPYVTTTGPRSLDPDTGKPYGMRFPVVLARDSVRVHKALIDALGIRHLRAVAGPSGGSVQAFEWAATYPGLMDKVIAVISPGLDIHPYMTLVLDSWSLPIRLDPAWNNGNYYGRAEPVAGVTQALKIVTLNGRHYGWAEQTFGFAWADPARDPARHFDARFKAEAELEALAQLRAQSVDANHMLYTNKAYQAYRLMPEQVRAITAEVLLIPASSDLIFIPELSRRAARTLKAQGNRVEYFELQGDGGHFDGIGLIGQADAMIRGFLAA